MVTFEKFKTTISDSTVTASLSRPKGGPEPARPPWIRYCKLLILFLFTIFLRCVWFFEFNKLCSVYSVGNSLMDILKLVFGMLFMFV